MYLFNSFFWFSEVHSRTWCWWLANISISWWWHIVEQQGHRHGELCPALCAQDSHTSSENASCEWWGESSEQESWQEEKSWCTRCLLAAISRYCGLTLSCGCMHKHNIMHVYRSVFFFVPKPWPSKPNKQIPQHVTRWQCWSLVLIKMMLMRRTRCSFAKIPLESSTLCAHMTYVRLRFPILTLFSMWCTMWESMAARTLLL